jgi:hypothetical protein
MSDLDAKCAGLFQVAAENGAHELFTPAADALLTEVRNTAVKVGGDQVLVDVRLARCAVGLHWARYRALAGSGRDGTHDLAGALAVLAAYLGGPEIGQTLLELSAQLPPGERHDLVVDLSEVWREYGEPRFLVAAIVIGRAQVAALAPADPVYVPLRSNLATLLYHLGLATGSDEQVDEAIRELRAAMSSAADGGSAVPLQRVTLADMLRHRYERHRRSQDLDEAVSLAELADQGPVAPDDPDPGFEPNVHGLTLLARADRDVARADLDAAVDRLREAVARTPRGHPEAAGRRGNLALALTRRASPAPHAPDLDEAVSLLQDALTLVPEHHADRVPLLVNLCEALQARAGRSRQRADIQAALDTGRTALDLTPQGHPDRSVVLSAMSLALAARFQVTGDPADADEVVDLLEQAVESAASGTDEHARCLGNLGLALRGRFERSGRRADIDRSIECGREAVEVTPAGGRVRAHRLGQLAGSLLARFVTIWADADAAEAIELFGQVLDSLPGDDPDRFMYLANRGLALADRWQIRPQERDLDAAAADLRAAASLQHAGRPTVQSTLCGVLRFRYEQRHDATDLQEAVEFGRAAVAESHPARNGFLNNLGLALQLRYEVDGDPAVIDEAIEVGQAAVAQTPPGHPDLALILTSLGHAYRLRFKATENHRDGARSVSAFRRAYRNTSSPPMARLRAARSWGLTEIDRQLTRSADRRRWDGALAGLGAAVRLLPEAAWHGLSLAERSYILGSPGGPGGLPGLAASTAILAGRLEQALELLESSRGVLNAQVLEQRGTLAAVRAIDSELAERMSDVAGRLQALRAPEPALAAGPLPRTWPTGDRPRREGVRELAQAWQALLGEARQDPRLAGLFEPTPFSVLRVAGEQGPVVVVNVSSLRCDALILDEGRISLCPLPGLDTAALDRAVRRHLGLMILMRRWNQLTPAERQKVSEGLRGELAWLWTVVAEPVLRALGLRHRDEGWPRLWWCPTSLLSLLPLHAAQSYDRERGVDSGVIDRVVSSTVPTVRSLIEARARRGPRGPLGPALLVALSQSPGRPPLLQVRDEVDWLRDHADTVELIDAAATVNGVRELLGRHAWLHFAGHSSLDTTVPGRSGLHLHNGTLSVGDIAEIDLSQAELAFLSSCEGGAVDPAIPDEPLHIAGAMLMAGYRHVIAAAWVVGDETASELSERVYAPLLSASGLDTGEVARSLQQAIMAVRAGSGPESWAAHLHSGV